MRVFCFSLLLLFLNVGHSNTPKYKNSNWYLDLVETKQVLLYSPSTDERAFLRVVKQRGGWHVGLLVQAFLTPSHARTKTHFEAIRPNTFWGNKHTTLLFHHDYPSGLKFLGWSESDDLVLWIMEKELIKVNFKTMNGKEISYTFNVSQLEGAMTEILRQQAALR